MQQRRLRLGDILDDYCPRERRITNHVIVAMIEDDIRQTRCSTCDAEHGYKDAKAPTLRRKKTGVLSQDGAEEARPRAVVAARPAATDALPLEDDDADAADGVSESPTPQPTPNTHVAAAPLDEPEPDERPDDDGPVHRRLIRATLPRPEGHVPERKEPDFTMRQQTGREADGNRYGQRPRGHRPARQAQGQGQPGGHNRFGGQRQGAGASRQGAASGQGQGQGPRQGGNRPGQPAGQRGGGRPGGQNRGGQGRKRGR